MSDNKTHPTQVNVDDFLTTVDATRAQEARTIMAIMHRITGEPAMM